MADKLDIQSLIMSIRSIQNQVIIPFVNFKSIFEQRTRGIFGQELNLYIRQMMYYKLYYKNYLKLKNMPAVANLTDLVIILQNQVIIPSVFESPFVKNYLEYRINVYTVNPEEIADIE